MHIKHHILILTLLLTFLTSCSVHRDRQRIEQAEALLYSNRDSAELLLRQVERPERLDDAHLAKYWLTLCDLHANSMQSLSEDSMICWAADYYRHQWEADHSDAGAMIMSGELAAMYYWWNGDKEKAQEVLQRQQHYADEVAERTGEHLWQVIVLRVSAELAMRDYQFDLVRDYTEALIALDDGKAIHLDEVERVYNALAIVYFSLGEYDKMEQSFEKAIANAADSVFITNVVRRNYADLLGETGQTDRAIRMLEELTEQYRQAGNWLQVESLYSLSRLWLNKGDKQRTERYMNEADALFAQYKESSDFDPATEAAILAHKQVLEYATKGTYHFFPLVKYLNHWSEDDYVRYRIAEAKENAIRDLQERNLYLTISRQRQAILIIAILFIAAGAALLFWLLYRRRKQLLLQKEEEIETLQRLLSTHNTQENNVQQMMLRQLGIIKTIAGTPTEANQHLLEQLMTIDENQASALIDWQSIYQTIDAAYNGFYTKLTLAARSSSPATGTWDADGSSAKVLNEKEIQLCCLLRAGFSTKEIHILTRQSIQTIYQRKTQIRQKLGLQEGEDIIESLV